MDTHPHDIPIGPARHLPTQILVDSEWLDRYDNLSCSDLDIKAGELRLTLDHVRSLRSSGRLSPYLDIGTCTARYPLAIAPLLQENDRITAIDLSEESCSVAQQNLARARSLGSISQDVSIKVIKGDITAPSISNILGSAEYNLITCMMGTLSHLNLSEKDGWRRAVQNVARLLAPSGALILGLWSDHAISNRAFLSLYTDEERDALAGCSPPTEAVLGELSKQGITAQLSKCNSAVSTPAINVVIGRKRR